MKTAIYNQKGEKVKEIDLPESLFGLPWNPDLVHQIVVSMQSNRRDPWAHTKDRSEVSGGGRKPWRQKGLGRARHGSIRSPIWVGGGVAHGPTKEKDYSKKINKKMKRKALLTVLSQKLRDNEILFLDKINLVEPKTKEAEKIVQSIASIEGFERLKEKKGNRAIISLPEKEDSVYLSFRNLPGMEIFENRNLNPLDILNYKYLIVVNPENLITFLNNINKK